MAESLCTVSISVVCLVITAVVYLAIAKIRTESKTVLVFLCLTLAIADLLFLLGVDKTESQGGCMALSMLMHFFFLAAFMWMLVEGWLLYRTFTSVFSARFSDKKRMLPRYCLIAYGVPALIVAITAGVTGQEGYRSDAYCWLTRTGHTTIWAFVAPAALIVLVNVALFARILAVILKLGDDKRVSVVMRRGFKASLSFLTVMGMGWGFGLTAIGSPEAP